jgi:uncharacterized protein YbgA (DUF1722 family)
MKSRKKQPASLSKQALITTARMAYKFMLGVYAHAPKLERELGRRLANTWADSGFKATAHKYESKVPQARKRG